LSVPVGCRKIEGDAIGFRARDSNTRGGNSSTWEFVGEERSSVRKPQRIRYQSVSDRVGEKKRISKGGCRRRRRGREDFCEKKEFEGLVRIQVKKKISSLDSPEKKGLTEEVRRDEFKKPERSTINVLGRCDVLLEPLKKGKSKISSPSRSKKRKGLKREGSLGLDRVARQTQILRKTLFWRKVGLKGLKKKNFHS